MRDGLQDPLSHPNDSLLGSNSFGSGRQDSFPAKLHKENNSLNLTSVPKARAMWNTTYIRTRSSVVGFLATSWMTALMVFGAPETGKAAEVLGWMEKAKLYPSEVVLNAKLDTGADNSSLDADDVTIIKKEGRQWVRFTVTGADGRQTTLERPFVRTALIKGRSKKLRKRPVVSMGICVGGVSKEVEVNLTDRTHFMCPLIIGRSFLAGAVIVDSGRRYTREITCTGAGRP